VIRQPGLVLYPDCGVIALHLGTSTMEDDDSPADIWVYAELFPTITVEDVYVAESERCARLAHDSGNGLNNLATR